MSEVFQACELLPSSVHVKGACWLEENVETTPSCNVLFRDPLYIIAVEVSTAVIELTADLVDLKIG